jgi:hypothetical protein
MKIISYTAWLLLAQAPGGPYLYQDDYGHSGSYKTQVQCLMALEDAKRYKIRTPGKLVCKKATLTLDK